MRLAQSYDAKLRAREFVGILDAPHPPCGGRAFARVEGDRLLRLDCPDGYGRYALDDHAELREYTGPVRLGDAEAVVAFCGREPRMLLAHPKFEPSLVARARAALPPPWSAPRLPSVLVLMVDATSRAHFRRSLPLTLAALEELGTPRRNKPPPPHVFDFEHYNIVGYNSIPNQMPLFCNVAAEELHDAPRRRVRVGGLQAEGRRHRDRRRGARPLREPDVTDPRDRATSVGREEGRAPGSPVLARLLLAAH